METFTLKGNYCLSTQYSINSQNRLIGINSLLTSKIPFLIGYLDARESLVVNPYIVRVIL